MAKGKKKGGKRRGDDTDSDNEQNQPKPAGNEEEAGGGGKKLSRKELRMQKQQKKQQQQASKQSKDDDDDFLIPGKAGDDYGEDSDENSAPAQPTKKLSKKQQKKQAAKMALLAESSEEDEDEEQSSEEEEPPQPAKKLTKKQLKKLKEKEADARAQNEEEDESDESEEDSEEQLQPAKKLTKKQLKKLKEKQAEEFESFDEATESDIASVEEDMKNLKIVDFDDEPSKKKKKKDKKKSKKKEEEENAGDNLDEDAGDDDLDEEAKAKAAKRAEKARRKAEKEAKKMRKAEKEAKKMAELAAQQEKGEENTDDGENELMYGAPDDVAWTDKSHSQVEEEKMAKEGPDLSLIYGPDGKKLSNKERKRALKAKQAAEREAAFEESAAKASREGAQFACSQTAITDAQWDNALDINVPSFNISAAGKILFKDASLIIGKGRHYGLVGPNGKGKSTLLKMIASGDLRIPPRIDFLYVEQEVVADNTPAVEAVLRADTKRWELLEEESALMKEIDDGDEDPKKINRLQEVFELLSQMGADSSEAKARKILYGLGFDMEMQTKPTKMFSGGWRMRISLARALFMEPTLLMLDEPTNHLDLNAVIWLDDYLQRWKKTLLVVSHDQDFLNSVCQEILHIEDLKLISYKGNYDSFKKAEKTKFKQQQKAWEKQQKRLNELKRSGQSKAKATENVKKSSKREPGARSAKKKKDEIASGAAAAESTELIKRPKEYHVKLEFAEVAELSRPVMEVNRVHFRYGAKYPVIFDEIDFGIDMDSRLCVVGPNGAGKSTLLKLLTGEVQATTGEVRRNPRLRMGIYNQHFVDRLPMGKTPVEHLRDRFDDEDYQSIRNRLGKYGLEGHAHEVVMRDLSGGQKARVVFVELSLQRPHILLLDEPTNNLDIETIDALILAINEFNGGIVVVTHDQRLIDECECDLWVVEKQGVTKWDAGFDDYKDNLLRELEEQSERDNAARMAKLEAAAAAREEKIARLKNKIKS